MPSLDRTTYIADVCLAARRMGIYLREVQDNGQYRFDWYDAATDATIIGEIANDRINAFELACNRLTTYLKYNPKP